MLVGLKSNPDDVIKWGMGVGAEYYDPFWYGENDSVADISVSDNITMELGSRVNITTNISGASTVCVDIDHPEYGDNYTCGSPNAQFTFNISYFREDEFNDSLTVKTISPSLTLNETDSSGGVRFSLVPSEVCSNITISGINTLKIIFDVESTWINNASTDMPIINIRDNNTILLESITANVGEEFVYANNLYKDGEYGFCIKNTNSLGDLQIGWVIASPTWPSYEISEIGIPEGPKIQVDAASDTIYISSHHYDEVKNLSINQIYKNKNG